jgi:hypothetical protein
MLLGIALLLVALWLAGTMVPHKLGGFIHLLLVLALVLILIRFIPGLPFPRY